MPSERTICDLAFSPNLPKRQFDELLTDGYSQSEAREITCGILERDLTYYFLEYFAKEKLVQFSYHFSENGQGERILLSPKYEAMGDVCGLWERAIETRRAQGKPIDREEAELEGFRKIKEELAESSKETSFLLVSPSPPASEKHLRPNFGDYNFVFFGHFDPKTRVVKMFAWRNNLTIEELCEMVNRVADKKLISGYEAHSNDFLRTPVFVNGSLVNLISVCRRVSDVVPRDEDFGKTSYFESGKYQESFSKFASHLASQIADGVGDEVLEATVAFFEMEFVKWVRGGKAGVFEIPQDRAAIMAYFGQFQRQYGQNLSEFRGGSCGVSILSTFAKDIFSMPGIMTFSLGFGDSGLGLGDRYGIREIHCESCGVKYLRDHGKLEKCCRFCGGKKGIVC